MELYADIIVNIAHENLDRPFQYRIPDALAELVTVGCQVQVPFGAANKKTDGYCIGIGYDAEYDPEKIKDILEVKAGSTSMESKQILLADFLKRRYGVTMIQALKTVLPVKQTVRAVVQKYVCRAKATEELQQYYDSIKDNGNQKAKARILAQLLVQEEITMEEVRQRLEVSISTVKSLEANGWVLIKEHSRYRDPVRISYMSEAKEPPIILSEEQQYIVDTIISDMEHKKDGEEQESGKYYIHGITGSGKTAVYIELIQKVLKQGRQAIVLIPEISLTYQTLKRFYARFGHQVSVINSTLSAGEKYDQIKRAMEGDVQVIIGPRSALFTPFPNLGLIIMDEEHEPSYKSEQSPKYHAREVAEEIAEMYGAGLVLGSATPSMEAYYQVKQGRFQLFELKKRLTGAELPTVEIVDLREELQNGNRSIFSVSLQEKMTERLKQKEQFILFLNRRGYAGFISCRSCGHVMRCPHCDISLSEHRDGRLYCHYCGYSTPKVRLCPECGSKYILGFKVGTQQIEDKLKEMYPGIRVLRMDADTTRTKESYEKILSAFAKGEADVLLGTQMIVKGHDFPGVTLVGVLAADMSLACGDYRSGERTFQLLTQAAGRAGRGDKPGQVVIQTYQPDHYSILHASEQDYEGFFKKEMAYRELMQYPPAGHMMAIQLFGEKEARVKALSDDFGDYIRVVAGNRPIQVLGPTVAAIAKVKDIYRYVIYVKATKLEALLILKNMLEERKKTMHSGQEIVQYDFDPVNTF